MGTSERKQREKEQRRLDIILAAEKTFFAKGIAVATIDDVAETAELSKGTIYLYFKDREEIIAAIFGRGMGILGGMMAEAISRHQDAISMIGALGKTYLAFAKKFPGHFALMLETELHRLDADDDRPEACSCVKAGLDLLSMLREILARGMAEGTIRNDIDPAQLAIIVWGQLHGVIAIASHKETCTQFSTFCAINLESIVTATISVIINGIRPDRAAL